jgi:hypothetical protein
MEIISYMPSLLFDGLTSKTMLVLLFPPVTNNSFYVFHILSMCQNTFTNETASLIMVEDALKGKHYLVASVTLGVLAFWQD